MLRGVVRQRDVIVLDQRGTGDSGALSCPELQTAASAAVRAAAAECAATLGARRAFYTTADSVGDLEALRVELGYEQIALLATSYGAKAALDYASAHPDHVERLVLESPVGPGGVDALARSSFAASTRIVRQLCGSGCRAFTPDPLSDLSKLARMLGREPLRGPIVTPKGQRTRASLTSAQLFAVLSAGDAHPGIRRRFPAAVRAAVTGDTAPILRLMRLAELGERSGARTRSAATRTATLCEETALPWAPEAPFDDRPRQTAALAAAQPPGTFAPFDAGAAVTGEVPQLCALWPSSSRPTVARGAMPDIPALILSGTQNIRAPTEEARRVTTLFSRGQLLAVPGVGEDLLTSDGTGCPTRAVRRFLMGRSVAARCPQVAITPTGRDPLSLRSIQPAPRPGARSGRTVAAVRKTYQDALRSFFDLHEDRIIDNVLEFLLDEPLDAGRARLAAGGLRSGSYTMTPSKAVLRNLSYIPGVRVSGTLRSVAIFPAGILRVRGRDAAHGTLRVRDGVMQGRLGGQTVRARLGPDLFDLALLGGTANLALAASREAANYR